MSKVKFEWEFILNKEEKELTVNLNGGCNCIIDLAHGLAFEHIARKLTEIMEFEHYHGTKTNVKSLGQLYKAMNFINEGEK
jgi:hypothetical protein